MNLILLFDSDFIDGNRVQLCDRRHQHIKTIHKACVGETLMVGLLNGKMGTGLIEALNDEHITLKVHLHELPPAPLDIRLIVALPRPNMLKRILQTCATMGVKKIILMHSSRVEKSYWQTPWLEENKITENLILGLEQAKDTALPEIILEPRFKPFIQDRLPSIIQNTTALVAHPNSAIDCPSNIDKPVTLLIGPEGGFIPYEIEQLTDVGCQSVSLGSRILRVETAVTALLSRLF